ncbi:MAG: glycosyltransferase family 2 protein [Candidatus Pacebacteria bacterium]|nr:glycosyltransferase family 2 protein [Candidatus Paceibacterota bacterium]
MIKFSIIIPTWNKKNLLKKNLPLVIAAGDKEEVELVVVDNGSIDGSVDFLKKISAETKSLKINLLELPRNFGFAYAVNLGAEKARGEFLVLLNNDVVPEKGFLKPVGRVFLDPKVFALSLNEPQFSWAGGEFKNGFLAHKPGEKTKKIHHSLWASGGSGVFRKRIWQELGGFDLLYEPFYWEDVDLSYRAWKRGYRVLWEPEAVVHHLHEASVSRFPKKYVDLIKQRNELLFIWKNITSQKMFSEHKRFLVKRLRGKPGYFKVLLATLIKTPQVLVRRRQEKKAAKLTDEEVFFRLAKKK